MTGSPKKARGQRDEIELRPDGWGRFERAVDAAVKGGPKHRTGKAKTASKAAKKRR